MFGEKNIFWLINQLENSEKTTKKTSDPLFLHVRGKHLQFSSLKKQNSDIIIYVTQQIIAVNHFNNNFIYFKLYQHMAS